MFTNHIATAIVVIPLSRPQMATLVSSQHNQVTMSRKVKNHIPTEHEEERGDGDREPRGDEYATEPQLGKVSRVYAEKRRSSGLLTLQLK